jgi:multidrug efflux pump subunit AcrA (membrane-fusion protein)
MTAKLKFVPYLNEDALWVPKGALFEGNEPGSQFVNIHRNDRKHKKVKVETGRRSGDKVEILKGLRAGAEILLEKPGK